MTTVVLGLIPYATHRQVVAELAAEARENPLIIGALLIGSLGRGNALPGSDVDILFLLRQGHAAERLFHNHERHGVAVEFHFRDVDTARSQLEREPSWLYAYLDSHILYDPEGVLAQLDDFAREQFAAYRSPPTLKRRYAFLVDRTRHKLQAAVEAEDALRAGAVASTYAQLILDGLWIAHDRPQLGVSEMWARLPDLTDRPAELVAALRSLFLGPALERAQAGMTLCEWIVDRLGGAVLDPYQDVGA